MDKLNLMLIHARGTPAEEHIQTLFDKIGTWAPEIMRARVMAGYKCKGLYEICVTWFPEDNVMKELYKQVYNEI
jgi:hypothetical protein